MAVTGDLSPNPLSMVFNELILALCSICNMYRNTVHLCIYYQKNVYHVAHESGTIFSPLFLKILQYFNRHCSVGRGLHARLYMI